MAYENFVMEVGLYDCPLDWNYNNFGHLATENSWFCNLWNLTHTFHATLIFQPEDQVHGARERDQPLMSEFFWVGYRGSDLNALNIVHRFCNLLHLSNILKCNRITLVSNYAETSLVPHLSEGGTVSL
jgi:hypothetical protein